MKHLKQKLMGAIAMVLVSAVMLSTSTYAWFAISTAPEVGTVSFSMEATKSLEIALGEGTIADTTVNDTGTDTTWGSSIGSTAFSLTDVALPATIDSDALKTVSYSADDGRTSGLVGTTVGTYSGGIATITTASTDTLTAGMVVGNAIAFHLRTNTAGTISATFTDILSGTGALLKVTNGTSITYVTVTDETESATIATVAANDDITIEMYVFYDGSSAQNSDLTSAKTIGISKIEFSNSGITS